MRFLSAEWIEAVDQAARDVLVDADTKVLIEQTVSTEGGPPVTWHTRVGDGSVRFISGPASAADVRLSCDRATAVAVSRGELSAPRAFLDGRLRLDGDVSALMNARAGLDAIADAFALVRADTIFD